MKWLGTTCMVGLVVAMCGTALAQTPAPVVEKPACRGIPESDWGGSALVDGQLVRSVQQIKSEAPVSEAETVVPRGGARIALRAAPGMTAEWLQRIAECHMAQVAAASPWMLTSSPLDVKGALISVQSSGDGFAVDITSPDLKVAKDILTRARGLTPPRQMVH